MLTIDTNELSLMHRTHDYEKLVSYGLRQLQHFRAAAGQPTYTELLKQPTKVMLPFSLFIHF